jgi:hypothetical protein
MSIQPLSSIRDDCFMHDVEEIIAVEHPDLISGLNYWGGYDIGAGDRYGFVRIARDDTDVLIYLFAGNKILAASTRMSGRTSEQLVATVALAYLEEI